ncbi:thioesterase superfamily protein [Desulfobulbus propionicus DSM 2032]|jgi:acyl-CoA thioester hydrolase|uniref:Thioesterase superfamily protein n=1 Tax=Desulfobulbus propionicus (strain ATCC 33891 / DSM 2032 / VKM B-1956 / 1pr3) TaxID=577650 RepID=A0A7U3YJW5_DESPD|nr:acyl-CoA thioesterase [Desulfobulbus propionicus]ADW16739.1 thioesterase superfamily protein [Desulfobulbus propionicus DSM 2032]
MTAVGTIELVVPESAIDLNGHVNNVQYVQWMQEAAIIHSTRLGWPTERYLSLGRTWIIRSHSIEYFHSAYAGETIHILTWVAEFQKIRSLRKYKFLRPADNTVLATASTLFIFCDLHTGRPVSIPPEVQTAYTVVATDGEP